MMNKTTTIRNILVMVVFLAVACSCDGGKPILRADLNLALRLSEENRPELEKVLKHYSIDKKDTLKLKAAKFLISNMIRHYSVTGEYMDRYMKQVDFVHAEYPQVVRNIYYMIATRSDKTSAMIDRELDLQNITGDFLIKNIDYSFELWENSEHLRDISFDDFCEYILPYNVNHEPLREWKDSSMFKYYGLGSLETFDPDLTLYSDYIALIASKYYRNFKIISPDTLIGSYMFDCIDFAFNEVMIKRSMGMPSTVDYVPHYPTSDNRHYWVVDIDYKYKFNKNSTFSNPNAAKVYRKTYSINTTPEDMKNFVPDILRDPYSKDVTEEYEKVSTVECKIRNVPFGVKYGYLAVFNNLAWREVAWSKFSGSKLAFEKMGREVMYIPTYYVERSQKFGKYPIYVNMKGEAVEVKPDKNSTQTLTLERKFPLNVRGEDFGKDFIGCQILACDDLKEMKFDTMAVIDSYWNMAFDTVHIKSDKKYKNWLFQTKNKYSSMVSELEFYNENGELPNDNHYIVGPLNNIDTISGISNTIFDGDLLTSGHISNMVGLTYNEPVSVSYVKYISNNDENGVYPGNEYELFYFDDGNWVSLGRKVATGYSIEYENAPTNALFWLRNNTKGKEERPFTVDNGKIKFW